MRDFVIVIFVLIGTATLVRSHSDIQQQNQPNFYTCLNNWRLWRERRDTPSAFLTDQTLMEEVCRTGMSVDDMDKCMKMTVDVYYTNVLAWWSGNRDMMSKICSHYNDFMRYHLCRTNPGVVHAFDTCPDKKPNPTCSDYQRVRACLHTTIESRCTGRAATFFSMLVDTQLSPLMVYQGCQQEIPRISKISIHAPRSTQRPQTPTSIQRRYVIKSNPALDEIELREYDAETEFEAIIDGDSTSSRTVHSVFTLVVPVFTILVIRLVS